MISGSWASSDTVYYQWNELQTRDLFQIYYIFKGNEYIKYNVTNRQVRTMGLSELSITSDSIDGIIFIIPLLIDLFIKDLSTIVTKVP